MVRAETSQMFLAGPSWDWMRTARASAREALAAAVGAECVAAVLGEEDADVELVLLALERGEEAADAGVVAAAFPEEFLLVGVEVVPGDVGGDGCGLGEADHLAVVGAVLGRGPRGDGALREGAGAVGEDEVGVEVDGVAEALAAGARAVGIVEREEAGLRLAVSAVAGGALECGGVAEVLRRAFVFAGDGVEEDFAGLAVAGFDGVYDSAPDFRAEGEAVDEDVDGAGEVEFEEGFGRGELDDFARCRRVGRGLVKAVVAAAAEFGEAVLEGVGEGQA